MHDYQCHNFCNGQVLDAETLNEMDHAILAANQGVVGVVDRLAHPFSKTGLVVTCEPVEGHPMTVTADPKATTITRCGKNMFTRKNGDTDLMITRSYITEEGGDSFEREGYQFNLPPGEYTVRAIPVGEWSGGYINASVLDNSDKTQTALRKDNGDLTTMTMTPKTVTLSEGDVLFIGDKSDPQKSDAANLFSRYHVQIEVGNRATAFEEYHSETDTFAPGEPIPALPGVNTIWADKGSITVTGRANPAKVEDGIWDERTAWPGKKVIDRLCPALEKTGYLVTCEPVPEYPLSVSATGAASVIRCGKNLFNVGEGYAEQTFIMRGGDERKRFGYCLTLPYGDYTIQATRTVGDSNDNLYTYVNDKNDNWVEAGYTNLASGLGEGTKSITIHLGWGDKLFIVNGKSETTFDKARAIFNRYDIQVEVGIAPTTYEGYNGGSFLPWEEIPALPGVNYLWAKDKDGNSQEKIITVTGREDLATRLAALEAALINA